MEAFEDFWAMVLSNSIMLVIFICVVIFLLWLARDAMKSLIESLFINVSSIVESLSKSVGRLQYDLLEENKKRAQTFALSQAETRLNSMAHTIESHRTTTLLKTDEKIHEIAADVREIQTDQVKNLASAKRGVKRVLRKVQRSLERIVTKIEDDKKVFEKAQDRVNNFDKKLEEYRNILESDNRKDIIKNGPVLMAFFVSILIIPLIVGGGILNFQLIARPMAEIVGSSIDVAGFPIYQVAAAVMIALEAAAGIIFFDAVGITNLFGLRDGISDPKVRRGLAIGAGLLLFTLASLEAGLAIVREFIIAGERELSGLAAGVPEGAEGADDESGVNVLSMIVQGVLGFTIPFLLACVARYTTILGKALRFK